MYLQFFNKVIPTTNVILYLYMIFLLSFIIVLKQWRDFGDSKIPRKRKSLNTLQWY